MSVAYHYSQSIFVSKTFHSLSYMILAVDSYLLESASSRVICNYFILTFKKSGSEIIQEEPE